MPQLEGIPDMGFLVVDTIVAINLSQYRQYWSLEHHKIHRSHMHVHAERECGDLVAVGGREATPHSTWLHSICGL